MRWKFHIWNWALFYCLMQRGDQMFSSMIFVVKLHSITSRFPEDVFEFSTRNTRPGLWLLMGIRTTPNIKKNSIRLSLCAHSPPIGKLGSQLELRNNKCFFTRFSYFFYNKIHWALTVMNERPLGIRWLCDSFFSYRVSSWILSQFSDSLNHMKIGFLFLLSSRSPRDWDVLDVDVVFFRL